MPSSVRLSERVSREGPDNVLLLITLRHTRSSNRCGLDCRMVEPRGVWLGLGPAPALPDCESNFTSLSLFPPPCMEKEDHGRPRDSRPLQDTPHAPLPGIQPSFYQFLSVEPLLPVIRATCREDPRSLPIKVPDVPLGLGDWLRVQPSGLPRGQRMQLTLKEAEQKNGERRQPRSRLPWAFPPGTPSARGPLFCSRSRQRHDPGEGARWAVLCPCPFLGFPASGPCSWPGLDSGLQWGPNSCFRVFCFEGNFN